DPHHRLGAGPHRTVVIAENISTRCENSHSTSPWRLHDAASWARRPRRVALAGTSPACPSSRCISPVCSHSSIRPRGLCCCWPSEAHRPPCCLAPVYPPTWHLVLLTAGSYLLRMWAITVGYHRYLSHRSFRTNRALQFVLALLGATAMQQGPLWWASWHRRHHEYADTPDDPHSPVVRHFWHP